jgi:hypothetical protein
MRRSILLVEIEFTAFQLHAISIQPRFSGAMLIMKLPRFCPRNSLLPRLHIHAGVDATASTRIQHRPRRLLRRRVTMGQRVLLRDITFTKTRSVVDQLVGYTERW